MCECKLGDVHFNVLWCCDVNVMFCMCSSLLSVHDEEKPVELEMAWISEATGKVFQRVPADILAAAEKAAKQALEDSDMCAPSFPIYSLSSALMVVFCARAVQRGCVSGTQVGVHCVHRA
jgi:hypothetical protein